MPAVIFPLLEELSRWLVHFKTAGIIEVGGSSAKYRNQQGNQEPPSPPSPPTPSTMVRRQISIELKEAALSMSLNGMPDAEIRQVTGISERSLKRLRSLYRKTGGVVPPPPLDPGRPRTLTAIHVKYLCDCVERRRDVPLSELRTELREVFDVNVSVQTVARSLQRVGVCRENARAPR